MNRLAIGVLGLLLAAGCCSSRCPVESGTSFARDAFAPYVESGEIPGAISVYYDDGVQETTCIGYADVEAKRPITLDDPFMQCSQTKGFCGVTVAILVEEGKIGLDDPVAKYLPEFKDVWIEVSNTNGVRRLEKAKNAITVRMCLNHTAGFAFELPNYQAMGGWSRKMPLRSVAVMAAAQPLLFEPGTKVQYSNTGIDVGAAIVEKVSGMRWEVFLQKRVFDPLGMADSTFRPTDAQLADKIELYEIRKGQKAKLMPEHQSMQRPYGDDRVFASAGAGLWTTARDQLKFYKMLMNLGLGDNGVRILKEETVKSILAKSTRAADLPDPNYSLGLIAPQVDGEDQWFGHGGAWVSQCMVNWHRRRLRMLVVQLVGDCYRFRDVNNQAADKFFKTKIDNSGADAYTGRMK